MKIDDDAASAVLANRHFLYRYLWRAFAAEPDDTLIATAEGSHALEACALAGDELRALQERIAQAVRDCREAGTLAKLQTEYTRLFVGPASLPAPPWESVYLCGENLIFQESTLAVRAAYRAAGYQAAGYPHEADDHLATELDFMASLAERASAAYEEGDEESVEALLASQLRFLEEHLCVWMGPFATRLEDRAGAETSAFYLGFARLCAAVCAADKALLASLLAAR